MNTIKSVVATTYSCQEEWDCTVLVSHDEEKLKQFIAHQQTKYANLEQRKKAWYVKNEELLAKFPVPKTDFEAMQRELSAIPKWQLEEKEMEIRAKYMAPAYEWHNKFKIASDEAMLDFGITEEDLRIDTEVSFSIQDVAFV